MKRSLATALLALPLPFALAVPAARETPDETPVYDERADAAQDLAAALAEARQHNRRVLIQWGANWCGWCKVLHALCGEDRDIARELLYEYEVVRVDVGRFDKHMGLAAKYGADLKGNGLPFLTVLDADGQVLASQETSSLEQPGEGMAHDPRKVLAFLEAHEAEPWKAEERLAAALARARKSGKRLFLSFGAPWCGWCHRLEAWQERPDVAALLAKDFVLLEIDTERDVRGKEVMLRYRASEQGGIPWFVFLDAEGAKLATSDGPQGNLGCPWTDEEIAAFGDILAKVVRELSAEDVTRLERTLVEQREAAEKKAAAQRAQAADDR